MATAIDFCTCGDYSYENWKATEPSAQWFGLFCQMATLAGTVTDGAIDVNVTGGTAPTGVGDLEGGSMIGDNVDVMIAPGWTSITWGAPPSNTGNFFINSIPVLPGMSSGHGVPPGFAGSAVNIVGSGNSGDTLIYSVIRPV